LQRIAESDSDADADDVGDEELDATGSDASPDA
jgi:hypothetical protein